MDIIRNELALLARDISDLEDTQNPRVLAKYPPLANQELREEINERAKQHKATLKLWGVRIHTPFDAKTLRQILQEEF